MTLQRLILTFKPEELILHAPKKTPSAFRSITASRASYLSRRRITSRSCSGRRLAGSSISSVFYLRPPNLARYPKERGEPANEQMLRNQSEWRALHATC